MIKTILQGRLALALVVLLGLSGSMIAQSPAYVEGDILVQLQGQKGEVKVPASVVLNDGRVPLEYVELISAPMNIHLLRYPLELAQEHELILGAVKSHPSVRIAQSNHFVQTRSTIPDDPQFDSQWQYVNTGQTGGTVDADIDIDEAWDITTGGLTATGDTIVVCVIDDGIDNDHPDIAPNLWRNHAEIPGNGIDDDGNGFIDDYRGWDTGSNTDQVYDGGGHGTPVAGIVGAKGDNSTGVTGVNWDVKLMIVQGGTGVESEVLEAYSYPLVMRQRFNETNGDEGAFVVSTNASWGIDFGQPSDAPLWCAFYDTLGTHGILNCGATINGNQNVDEVGDLPTACPSDYLITVTNMDHNDVKVNGAGYGAETIDLGAHGANAYNVQFGGGYGGFGGTSGATPHVSGTIALLYSLPCQNLMATALADPAFAAATVRDAILQGVDPNVSLSGITTTGGRLNVFNSMLLLQQNCGPCPAPYGVEITATDVSAMVAWTASDSSLTVDLEYREVGAATWMELPEVSSPYQLDGLLSCTEYELRLRSFCANDTSDYSIPYTFLTDGCCENPNMFGYTDVEETSATIEWSSVLAAEGYMLQYRPVGSTSWNLMMLDDIDSYGLEGLLPCTNYEVQIQTLCDSETIDFSPSINFYTLGCDDCSALSYCSLSETIVDEEWIASVTVGSWVNESANDSYYEDFTESIPGPMLEPGSTYEVTLVPGYSGQEWSEYFKIYLDHDLDGTFEEEEVLFSSGSASVGAVSGTMTIPADIPEEYMVMRVLMAYNTEPESCDLNSDYGQTEDYCVSIGEALGLHESELLQFALSPNPASGQVTIQLARDQQNDEYQVMVLGIDGKVYISEQFQSGQDAHILSLEELAAGIYQVHLRDSSGATFTRPLMVR